MSNFFADPNSRITQSVTWNCMRTSPPPITTSPLRNCRPVELSEALTVRFPSADFSEKATDECRLFHCEKIHEAECIDLCPQVNLIYLVEATDRGHSRIATPPAMLWIETLIMSVVRTLRRFAISAISLT